MASIIHKNARSQSSLLKKLNLQLFEHPEKASNIEQQFTTCRKIKSFQKNKLTKSVFHKHTTN